MSGIVHSEVLVHIQAPGSTKDDQRYRNIAREVLAFEPSRRFSLTQIELPPNNQPFSANLSVSDLEEIPVASAVQTGRQSDIDKRPGKTIRSSLKRKLATIECDACLDYESQSLSLAQQASKQYFLALPCPNCGTEYDRRSQSEGIDLHAVSTVDRTGSKNFQSWRAIDQRETNVTSPSQVAACGKKLILVTKFMRMLEHQQNVSGMSLPDQLVCNFRTWERGYWLLTIAVLSKAFNENHDDIVVAPEVAQMKPWTARTFLNFWDNLVTQIKADRLGPVALYRNELTQRKVTSNTACLAFQIRLYCWAKTITHQYLVLKWASGGIVDQVAMKWVGSNGRAVIHLPVKRATA